MREFTITALVLGCALPCAAQARTIARYNELAQDFLKLVKLDKKKMFGTDEPLAKCLAVTVVTGVDHVR